MGPPQVLRHGEGEKALPVGAMQESGRLFPSECRLTKDSVLQRDCKDKQPNQNFLTGWILAENKKHALVVGWSVCGVLEVDASLWKYLEAKSA